PFRTEKPHHGSAEDRGQGSTQDRTTDRQEQTFQKQLAHYPSTAGPECQPNGHLFLSSAGSREHEICQIRAGNEQHQSRGSQKQPQRSIVSLANRASPALA